MRKIFWISENGDMLPAVSDVQAAYLKGREIAIREFASRLSSWAADEGQCNIEMIFKIMEDMLEALHVSQK